MNECSLIYINENLHSRKVNVQAIQRGLILLICCCNIQIDFPYPSINRLNIYIYNCMTNFLPGVSFYCDAIQSPGLAEWQCKEEATSIILR